MLFILDNTNVLI